MVSKNVSNAICVIKCKIFQGQEMKNQRVKVFFPKAVMPRWESTVCAWRAGFQEINPSLFGFNRIALRR